MRVDVLHLVGAHAGVPQGRSHGAHRPVTVGRRDVYTVTGVPVAHHLGQHGRAAATCAVEGLQQHTRAAAGRHEPGAGRVERAARLVCRTVVGGERAQGVEARGGDPRQLLRAHHEHEVLLARGDQPCGLAQGVGAARAAGAHGPAGAASAEHHRQGGGHGGGHHPDHVARAQQRGGAVLADTVGHLHGGAAGGVVGHDHAAAVRRHAAAVPGGGVQGLQRGHRAVQRRFPHGLALAAGQPLGGVQGRQRPGEGGGEAQLEPARVGDDAAAPLPQGRLHHGRRVAEHRHDANSGDGDAGHGGGSSPAEPPGAASQWLDGRVRTGRGQRGACTRACHTSVHCFTIP